MLPLRAQAEDFARSTPANGLTSSKDRVRLVSGRLDGLMTGEQIELASLSSLRAVLNHELNAENFNSSNGGPF